MTTKLLALPLGTLERALCCVQLGLAAALCRLGAGGWGLAILVCVLVQVCAGVLAHAWLRKHGAVLAYFCLCAPVGSLLPVLPGAALALILAAAWQATVAGRLLLRLE